jgi:hypothetical protein
MRLKQAQSTSQTHTATLPTPTTQNMAQTVQQRQS